MHIPARETECCASSGVSASPGFRAHTAHWFGCLLGLVASSVVGLLHGGEDGALCVGGLHIFWIFTFEPSAGVKCGWLLLEEEEVWDCAPGKP